VLKGRSNNKEAHDHILNALMCRWLNMNPLELKRLPFNELRKYKIIFTSIMQEKPGLLFGL